MRPWLYLTTGMRHYQPARATLGWSGVGIRRLLRASRAQLHYRTVTQSSDRSDAPPPLAGLAPFLGRAWPDAPAELRPVLQRLDEVTSRLQGSEPRITVFGAFKTGKSSLINALAGAPILPTGAQE